MTFAECEILADAALHLKAIAGRMRDPENVRELSYVLGMLAALPLENEHETPSAATVRLLVDYDRERVCHACGRLGTHLLGCEASSAHAPAEPHAEL